MKLQCELCREIVPADFAIGDRGIDVHCPACGGDYAVAATRGNAVELAVARAARRPAVASAGEPADAMTCPKCGDVQPRRAACRSCGLAAERMGDFAHNRDAGVSPEVAAAWDHAKAHWSDDDAHERVIRVAAAALAYPWVAQRYREALRLRPDDARAAEQLARVARMAEATLLSSATRRPVAQAKPFRGTLALLAGLVLLVAIGAVYATISARQRADEPAYERPRRPPAGATPRPTRPASRPAPQPASTTGAEAGTAAPAPTPAPRR